MTQSPAPRSAPLPPSIPPSIPPSTMPTGDPVLTARLTVPARPRPHVPRPRLTRRLSAAVGAPLTLVSGPAGAGKTVLAADWADRARADRATGDGPRRVVWLTVEPDDNAPGTFWAYVLEALRQRGVLAPDSVGYPASAEEVSRSLLARLAAQLAELPAPVVLVLDDFDHVCSPQVATGLHFVLAHAAGRLRLVLIGRTEPLLPLHRYRAAGDLAEIRCADLAFTPAEAAELLRGHGLPLPPEGMRALLARTEGWAAGLRLCALAMQRSGDPDGFLHQFQAANSPVADFLLAEALEVHPAATQDLLLRTSILERTHPGLADALTGRQDAAWILGSLGRCDAFVTPAGGCWYRHHPLFAEILRAHLHARYPGLEPELHRRAARWFDSRGRTAEAFTHAAAAGDWEFAADRFVADLAIGRFFSGLDTDRLRQLFSAMPPATSGAAPALVTAAGRLARHDARGALAGLARAEAACSREAPPAVLFGAAFLRTLAGRLLGAVRVAEAAAGEAARLSGELPPDLLERRPELMALVLTAVGAARLGDGRLDAAEEALAEALREAGAPGAEDPRQQALGWLALADLLRGRVRRAAARAGESVAAADRAGLPARGRSAAAQLALAGAAVERDRLADARSALGLAAASADVRCDPAAAAGLAVLRCRLRLAEGDAEGALDLARPPAAGTRPGFPRWAAAEAAWSAAAAHLARGEAAAALRAVGTSEGAWAESGPAAIGCAIARARARLAGAGTAAEDAVAPLPPPSAGPGPAFAVRGWLVRAQAAAAGGDPAAARGLVGRALAAAGPELLRRPFLEAGPWLRALLSRDPRLLLRYGEPGAGCPGRPAGPVPEPLTAREREVLRSAAQFLSTEEIADELCLSVNTVKTHLKSIHRKLSASRRGEAVRRARQLGLL